VLAWPGGKTARHVEVGKKVVGYLARSGPDGRLWFAAGLDSNTAYLVAVDLPEDELRADQEKPDLRLTAEGIFKK
jgi:hypothetical protein